MHVLRQAVFAKYFCKQNSLLNNQFQYRIEFHACVNYGNTKIRKKLLKHIFTHFLKWQVFKICVIKLHKTSVFHNNRWVPTRQVNLHYSTNFRKSKPKDFQFEKNILWCAGGQFFRLNFITRTANDKCLLI